MKSNPKMEENEAKCERRGRGARSRSLHVETSSATRAHLPDNSFVTRGNTYLHALARHVAGAFVVPVPVLIQAVKKMNIVLL